VPRLQRRESLRVEALDQVRDRITRAPPDLPRRLDKPHPVRHRHQRLGPGYPVRSLAPGAGDPFQVGPFLRRHAAKLDPPPLRHGRPPGAPLSWGVF
jgi:hypothetical protein